MARHEVVIHENTSTATKASAPYLGSYIAKETIALAQFASAVGLKCGLPAIQVIAILGQRWPRLFDAFSYGDDSFWRRISTHPISDTDRL